MISKCYNWKWSFLQHKLLIKHLLHLLQHTSLKYKGNISSMQSFIISDYLSANCCILSGQWILIRVPTSQSQSKSELSRLLVSNYEKWVLIWKQDFVQNHISSLLAHIVKTFNKCLPKCYYFSVVRPLSYFSSRSLVLIPGALFSGNFQ